MELRYYQKAAVQSVFDYYISGNKGNPIIVAAGGSGKSVIIGELARRIVTEYKDQRIIMATHRKQLIMQNHEKIVNLWPSAPIGIYSASVGKKQPDHAIVYGGIQSMYKKAELFGHRSFLFIDEVQLLAPTETGMYMKFIADLKKTNPYLKVVGFTATEWRTKGGSLLNQDPAIMTDICYRYDLSDALKDGFVTPLMSKSSVVQADLKGVKKIAGDFNQKQMEEAIDKEELTQAALDEISLLAGDRMHFLYFCAGIKHCYHLQEALKNRGVEAHVISHKTPEIERDEILEYAKNATERTVLINDSILTTGTDIPNLDCIVLLRATLSSGLFYQMLVRGTRLFPDKKSCLVLDFSGNIERFGAVDLLKAPKTKDGALDDGIAPCKICTECRSPVPISSKECPDCGFIFPEQERQPHHSAATTAGVMASEIKPSRHEIADVRYASHTGKSGVPSLKVSYYDSWGYLISEYVCFSHTGYPRQKADSWALKRGLIGDFPNNTEDALNMADMAFKKPTAIYTKKNGKYMEIIDYEFS